MAPLTKAEATGYRETSLHADVMAFITALAGQGDKRLVVSDFGASAQGRTLPLLILSSDGVSQASQTHGRGKPVVLLLGGIHAGEVEGKESLLMLTRDILAGKLDGGDWLDRMTILVAPLYNPDGNDALSPTTRAFEISKLMGQRGPELAGTRVNAANINLNRDYMRQEAVESRLLQANIFQQWNPHFTVDTHATNGSVHRFAMTYDVPHTYEAGRPEAISYVAEQMLPGIVEGFKSNFGLDAGWYGNFVEDERVLDAFAEADPTSPVREGWMTYPHHPRFGSNYRGLTGRLDLLLECYSYLSFEERVRTTYGFVVEAIRSTARRVHDILGVVAECSVPRKRIAVRARLEANGEDIEIPTYMPRTPEGNPTTVKVPRIARFVGTTVVDRPQGYLVPPEVGALLRRHGLKMQPAQGVYRVNVPTVEKLGVEGGRKILEASTVGEINVSWTSESRRAPEGALYVPTAQPRGAIAVYVCEPESDDGAYVNGVLSKPALGEELPVWRIEG